MFPLTLPVLLAGLLLCLVTGSPAGQYMDVAARAGPVASTVATAAPSSALAPIVVIGASGPSPLVENLRTEEQREVTFVDADPTSSENDWECMPLAAPLPDDCDLIADWMVKRPSLFIWVEPNECWAPQSESCRAFVCNENSKGGMMLNITVASSGIKNILNPNCGRPNNQAGHYWITNTSFHLWLASM